MNVIIANKQQPLLDSLTIDVIKKVNGVFTPDEIINDFKNFYFQRMILDITAIKDYKDFKNIQKLSVALDMDKVILLLDDQVGTDETDYISKLISMGIYNFARNLDGLMYLYDHPNTYRDVAQYQQLDTEKVEQVVVNSIGVRIIGIKDIASGSGATTLTYLMLRQLSQNYDTIAIEVDKTDFMYFNNKNMISTTSDKLGQVIAQYNSKDVILVDMNNSAAASGAVHDIIYLIEPSMIKLNKLMMLNPKSFSDLKEKKIVLNKSLLTNKDVLEFEYEARIKTFFNLPPLNEREKNSAILNTFLYKMGFSKQLDEGIEKRKKILGLF